MNGISTTINLNEENLSFGLDEQLIFSGIISPKCEKSSENSKILLLSGKASERLPQTSANQNHGDSLEAVKDWHPNEMDQENQKQDKYYENVSMGRLSPSTPFIVQKFQQIAQLRRDIEKLNAPPETHFRVTDSLDFKKDSFNEMSAKKTYLPERVKPAMKDEICFGAEDYCSFIWEVDGLQPLMAWFPAAPKVTWHRSTTHTLVPYTHISWNFLSRDRSHQNSNL